METAIAMVLLSRVLPYAANRWANNIVGILHTAMVAWSLTGDTPTLYYAFFATVEIACTLFIIGYAWTWRNPAGQLADSRLLTAEGRASAQRPG
jgi:hypothetical protein